MKELWIILAAIFIASAVILLWLGHRDAAFVLATLGVLAGFMNYRWRLKKQITAAEEKEADDG